MSAKKSLRPAFTFVEAVFTIAIIGIMAALAITAISNAARDSYRVVSRQQQAAVQEALNAWIMAQTRVWEGGTTTARIKSLETVRAEYNALPNTAARFNKLLPNPQHLDPNQRAGFLDQPTADHFQTYTGGNAEKIKSAALYGGEQYLSMPTWAAGEEPKVELLDE